MGQRLTCTISETFASGMAFGGLQEGDSCAPLAEEWRLLLPALRVQENVGAPKVLSLTQV